MKKVVPRIRALSVSSMPGGNSTLKLAASVKPDMYIDIHTGTLAMYAPWNHNSTGTCSVPPCTPDNDHGLAVLDAVQRNVTWTGTQSSWQAPSAGVGGIITGVGGAAGAIGGAIGAITGGAITGAGGGDIGIGIGALAGGIDGVAAAAPPPFVAE